MSRKAKTIIGSECIKGFNNVDPATALFAKRDEKTLRDAMRTFKPEVSDFIWTDKKTARRIYRTAQGVERILPSKKRVKFYNLLKELNVKNCSVKELKDTFKKIDNLEFIEYPEYVEDIVHPQLAKEKAKSTGLDEFFWD